MEGYPYMKRIKLTSLVKDEKDSQLGELDIDIVKVEVVRELMEINLFLEAKEIIDLRQQEKIEQFLSEKFPLFKVKTKIKYSLNKEQLEKVMGSYIKNLGLIIQEGIPSANSWLDKLDYKVNEGTLTLILPNELALFSMNRNGLVSLLKNKVQTELKLQLEIIKDDKKEVEKVDFLEDQNIEERKISKDVLKNTKKTSRDKGTQARTDLLYGKRIKGSPIKINEVNLQTGSAVIRGKIFQIESRSIRGNRSLILFFISDGTESIQVKLFVSKEEGLKLLSQLQEDMSLLIEGDIVYDNFSKSQVMMLKSAMAVKEEIRMDKAKNKRVELHLHTQMSSMDGVASLKKLAERAHQWGHKALAITDHGVVQAFPEGMELGEKLGIKMIYGVEGYLVNDQKEIISNFNPDKEYEEFIVFDIETTGLSAINDAITEIGAVKIRDGQVVDTFAQLINPERPIPDFIKELTGITDDMVRDKPTIDQVIPKFSEFIGQGILVAHNASFDVGFIREKMRLNNISLNNPVLDTLELSRIVFPELKSFRLNNLAKHLGVSLENHHRALDDAMATKDIFIKILELLEERNISNLKDINQLGAKGNINKDRPFHVTILAKNQTGLKNLYRLISDSHIKHFYRRPRIPKSLLEEHREGLIVGSACEAGELYQAILKNKSYSEIRNIVKFYDYLEIQPLSNNQHLIRNGLVKDNNQLKDINKQIYDLGKKYNKLVVATGDVHFLDPEDEVYRRILMAGQGFQDADQQPELYFRTTEEMLNEFMYLGKEKAEEVVITNTNKINDMVEEIKPIPDGTYPPIIEGSDKKLREITYKKAYEIYGDPLPQIVEERLNRELTSIIENGYAVMYIIAQKLVWQSNEDGYLVGSRGSVGSSFVATMSGITEVNPLVPHYVCPECKYSQFFPSGEVHSGFDLPDKKCPECDTYLNKDGQDIPFEVFLGFEGDKEPDIDLNFASDYQSNAHKYTEKLFGEGNVFRAGTIGTIADKTAYGFVKKYFEQKDVHVSSAEINRLLKGCTGIKRTSGQHPGGVMIVPDYKDILDFTPIQYPADDKSSGVITTHFDYNSLSGRILKLDILGHDVPGIIKMLEDMTGVDPTKIPFDEPETIEIFSSPRPLGVSEEDINCKVGTLGIPEFGTRFVRQMLVDTKPKTFSELVRISGLSHGTDVWLNNAQDLVKNNIATLSEVISTREDIMLYLINAGLDKQKAFWIMENVRRGKGLTEEEEVLMRNLDLPEWYIDSCNKIKYMFPKAHAAAYVMMSFRIAYFKVHYPEAFYATYFTTKVADFDAELILQGLDAVNHKINELESLGNDMTAKERNQLTVLEVVREMYLRGYRFKKIDLYKSDSDKFILSDDGILPPLKGLDGVGENAAKRIVEERKISKFISVEDLVKRARLTRTVIDALTEHGCLNGLPESNQISLFNI